jgi:hypothetical protein
MGTRSSSLQNAYIEPVIGFGWQRSGYSDMPDHLWQRRAPRRYCSALAAVAHRPSAALGSVTGAVTAGGGGGIKIGTVRLTSAGSAAPAAVVSLTERRLGDPQPPAHEAQRSTLTPSGT